MRNTSQNGYHIIKLEKGEEIVSSIKQFCQENKIDSGYFQAIGAVSQAKLSFYNLEKKEYTSQDFNVPLEIASLSGNIALLDRDIAIHCHSCFAKNNFSTIAGHLDQAIVSATCEIILKQLSINLTRKFGQEIGLNLLEL
jgi:predicted DNA-binding protein with PD1-like motif